MNGWRCPNCGLDNLTVEIMTTASLTQTLDRQDGVDENEYSTDIVGDHDWNGNSQMVCNDCGLQLKAKNFAFKSHPKGTIPVIAEKPVK